jgi:hypothetical protein
MPPQPEPLDRFLDRVEINGETGCWEWSGKRDDDGYGRFAFNGKKVRAHRWLFEFATGPIPEGLELDHLCRNRACVRPRHREPVTHAQNIRRGMTGKTEANGGARIL